MTPILTTQDAPWPLKSLWAARELTFLSPVPSFTPALCSPLMASCQSSALTVSCAHRLVVASHGPQEKVPAPSWGLKTSLALSPAVPPSTCSSDMGFSVGTSSVTPTVIPFPFLFTLFGVPSRFPLSLFESYSSLRLWEWILSRSLSLTIPVHPSQPPALSPLTSFSAVPVQ